MSPISILAVVPLLHPPPKPFAALHQLLPVPANQSALEAAADVQPPDDVVSDVRADQGKLNKVESHTTSMPGLAQIICQFFHLFRLFTAHSQTFNSFDLSLPQVLDGGFFAGLNRSAFLLHKCLVICSSGYITSFLFVYLEKRYKLL